MDKRNDMIVEQQLKIRSLEQTNAEYIKSLNEINGSIFCIGGPLNDNFHGYSKDQLTNFYQIAHLSDIDNDFKDD